MVREVNAADVVEATLTASRALVAVAVRSLASVLEEVTLPQWRVLVLLASRGPLRSGALADLLNVHPSTFSRTADRMVTAGLVRRTDNPESRREVLIELAPDGRRLVEDATEARRAEIEAILFRLSAGDRALVLRGMSAFAQAAGEPAADDLAALGV